MSWESKHIKKLISLVYGSERGLQLALVLEKTLAKSQAHVVSNEYNKLPTVRDSDIVQHVCLDANAATHLSDNKNKICAFWTSPYSEYDSHSISKKSRAQKYMHLHASLCRSKKIIALNENAREDLQLIHSQFIHHTTLPPIVIENTEVDDKKILIKRARDISDSLASATDFICASNSDIAKVGASTWDEPAQQAEQLKQIVIDKRPKLLLQLGFDACDQLPIRVMDAPFNDCVVIQIVTSNDRQALPMRDLHPDCIGFFLINPSAERDLEEISKFANQLLVNENLFRAVKSAQIKHLDGNRMILEDKVRSALLED